MTVGEYDRPVVVKEPVAIRPDNSPTSGREGLIPPSTYRRLNTAFIVELGSSTNNPLIRTFTKSANNCIYLPHMPEVIALNRQVDYERTPIPTAPEPLLIYSKTGALEFELRWQYVAGETHADRLAVIQECALLHSWSLPVGANFSDFANYKPPVDLLVVVGPWIRLRCLLLEVNTEMREPWGGMTQFTTVPVYTQDQIKAESEYFEAQGPNDAQFTEERIANVEAQHPEWTDEQKEAFEKEEYGDARADRDKQADNIQKKADKRLVLRDNRNVADTELMPTAVDVTCKFIATQFYNREASRVGGMEGFESLGKEGGAAGGIQVQGANVKEIRNRDYTRIHFYGTDSFSVEKGTQPGG